MKGLIKLNHHFVDQALIMLKTISAADYRFPCVEVFSSSIGQHFRHCIEHYETLLKAAEMGSRIDYEDRLRENILEVDPEIAAIRLRSIQARLANLTSSNDLIEVLDTGADNPATSSINRELQYLVSHTVHHYALIAVIASKVGHPLPQHFGIAPSTLRYRKEA